MTLGYVFVIYHDVGIRHCEILLHRDTCILAKYDQGIQYAVATYLPDIFAFLPSIQTTYPTFSRYHLLTHLHFEKSWCDFGVVIFATLFSAHSPFNNPVLHKWFSHLPMLSHILP